MWTVQANLRKYIKLEIIFFFKYKLLIGNYFKIIISLLKWKI